jgi:PAS domain S-box-containing protein
VPISPFQDPEVLRAILESLPIGLCLVDMEKRIILWSAGAERITGHRRHEVVGHSCLGEPLLHCNHQDCEWCDEDCPVARAMKTSHPVEASALLRHQAGHEVPVRVFAVPVHNPHGSIIGAVETFEERSAVASADRQDSNLVYRGGDGTTGVAGWAETHCYLRQILETPDQGNGPCSVLCFRLEGLDHFRHSCGPEAALALLRVVARTLEGSLWQGDFVGRWSDDRFLVILRCHADSLPAVGERLRRSLAGNQIEWWGEKRSLPVSIGRATAQAVDTVESLLQRVQESLASASLIHPATAQLDHASER